MASTTTQPVRAFDDDTLRSIYAATAGFCHRCRRKLAYSRFGCDDGRGAWDIDAVAPHPRATALLPACRACVRRAPVRPAPAEPAAPVPADTSKPADGAAMSTGALVGGAFGALLGGLWGALLGGLVGATFELHG